MKLQPPWIMKRIKQEQKQKPLAGIICVGTVSFNQFFGVNILQAWILAPDIGQSLAKSWVMSDESCFRTDTVVSCEVKNFSTSYRRLKTQKYSVSIVSMFYLLCLYKVGINIIIKKSSYLFLPYDLFDPPFVYCCSYSSRMVNKMVDFC